MKLNQKPLLIFTDKTDGNVAFHVGDNIENVIANHQALAKKYNYDHTKLVHMKQIHSDIVHVIEDSNDFNNPPTCDALITDKKNIPLMVMVADCSPIVFYDPFKSVIAVAHSGREGTFQNITKNVIESFLNLYDSKIDDIEVTVGPAIGVCCYEVGKEIADEAKDLGLSFAIEKNNGSYYLNIPAILKKQFEDLGISNYSISTECSCCNTDRYYSYRGEGQTGRFSAVAELR
ncbi:peptidoglycan editing factor PgeF [Sulfurimonas microaerophilic]|uniref:peptidoglycan editing factor PgeF n=1 Tax=Sulfurimonas microaerophilic TaxID=3058392 RepID=UPI0027151A7D|nr:peptidoglycan editing factor PgeF [Sulfurimonas sp. hsl 1-7]